jgi:hypothetical protein
MTTVIKLNEWLDENKIDSRTTDRLFLTHEQIRAYPQFKDATDEEVVNIINTLHQFALITYEIISREINANADKAIAA